MIKIIKGVFGLNNGTSIIPKTPKDEPFEAPADVEKRLVEIGVAEYVGKTKAAEEKTEPTAPTVQTEEATEEAEVDGPKELDKEALIARYKELGLGGNPANWKAETILKKIEDAEATLAEEVPDLSSDDGVVE